MYKISQITGRMYDDEHVHYISYIPQNAFYIASGKCMNELMDIITGREDRLVFCWSKTPTMKQLYNEWKTLCEEQTEDTTTQGQ